MKTKLFLLLFLSSFFVFGQETITDRLPLAKKIAQDFLKKQQIPGMAIAVSHGGDLIWSEGFGWSDLEQKTAVDPAQTQFRLASISKSITAFGLAILVDQHRLDFDESIYTYLPDFPKKKHDFTLRQVGGHLAGIRHYKGNEFIMNKKMSITEGLAIFKNDPLKSVPGTKYLYSTYGWNLLSVVIQEVAKQEFNQFMLEQIFNPLGMDHTRLDRSDQEMPQRTKFYLKTNQGKVVKGPEVSNEHKVAGGGFVGTAEDLIKFGQEVIHPEIISTTSRNELVKQQFTADGGTGYYGIGFVVRKAFNGETKYAHSGGGVGASTLLLIYPERDLVIVLLSNLSSASITTLGNALERHFLN